MKIKLNKQFLEAMAIAAACSAFMTGILGLLYLVSWGIVFVVLMLLFMPVAQGAIEFYEKEDCVDLKEFFTELMKSDEEPDNKIEW